MSSLPDDDVFTLAEIAAAARVSPAVVLDLSARGCVRTLTTDVHAPLGSLVAREEAVAAVRALAAGDTLGTDSRAVLAVTHDLPRSSGAPVLASTALHGLAALAVAAIASLGFTVGAEAPDEVVSREPVRLVYLALPGPGGGGGGGGLRQPTPPPKVQRAGTHSLSSPLPARDLPPPAPIERPRDPLESTSIVAPIASAPSDAQTAPGVLREAPPTPEPTHGPGDGGGAGTGQGVGLGEGSGSGIGDGSGGGTGGGAYRPGSGVEPPRLLKEVKAAYTDEARRQNIAGAVEMEITIRRDGTVSDVRVLRGLGGGLNERAVAAVRQWRFMPARMKGTPVDVIVEVSVEFSLR